MRCFLESLLFAVALEVGMEDINTGKLEKMGGESSRPARDPVKKSLPRFHFPNSGASSTFCQSRSIAFIQSVRDSGTKTTW